MAAALYLEIYLICIVIVSLLLHWSISSGSDSASEQCLRRMLWIFFANFIANLLFTVFNAVFIPAFYRDETKSGKNFLVSTIAVFVWIILWEGFMIAAVAAKDALPFFSWAAENLDAFPATAQAWRTQLIALAVGTLIYGLGTYLVSRKAVGIFERVDL